jgi:signal transduction histidine kinase
LALLLSALVMWRLASAALAPIETLTERAATLGSGDLHERLPITSPDDEVGRLTLVLNAMLERLERAFVQQRQFVADASHELRTPVAVLRTELDVTQANAQRSATEYRDSLARLDRVTARLERLVADLFLLARADAGGLREPVTTLDMGQLVRNTAGLLDGIADERGVRIVVAVSGDVHVRGHDAQLERVLLNLLDNALRYAPRDTCIELAVARSGTVITTDVRDYGPGIDDALVATLFDRFRRRVPHGGERPHDGAGLGLAIASSLMRVHNGTLTLLRTGRDGSAFRIELPAA